MSSLQKELAMRRERVVHGKHSISALTIALNESEIKENDIPVHMHRKQTAVQINKTTTLCLNTEEGWRKATPENHEIGYIKRILYGLEQTNINPKEFDKLWVCKTLSERTSRSGQWIDILLRHPAQIQVWITKADSGTRQVQTSSDVSMPCI